MKFIIDRFDGSKMSIKVAINGFGRIKRNSRI